MVYVVNWIHRYVMNNVTVRDVTFIGVYSCKEKVDKAIEKCKTNKKYEPYCNDDVTEWGEFETIQVGIDMIDEEIVS